LRKARSVASEQREGSQHNNMSFELCENRMHCSAAQCTSQLDVKMFPDKKQNNSSKHVARAERGVVFHFARERSEVRTWTTSVMRSLRSNVTNNQSTNVVRRCQQLVGTSVSLGRLVRTYFKEIGQEKMMGKMGIQECRQYSYRLCTTSRSATSQVRAHHR